MSSILTNNSAMVALDTLRGINKNLEGVQSEISTGKKIANSTDNAAIWSIATVMESDVKSFDQVSDSLNLGSATVGVARAGAEQVTDLLQEAKALIVAANDPSVSDTDRSKYQTDISELTGTIGSIVDAASFNGQNLLKGSGEIEVLSSLNRQDDGTVSAGRISVGRNNLSTAESTLETATVGVATSAGTTATENGGGTAPTITIAAGTLTEDTTYTVDVGGTEVSYVASAGLDEDGVAAGLNDAINSALDGTAIADTLTATVTDNVVTLTNSAPVAATAGDNNVTIGAATSQTGEAAGGLNALASIDVGTAEGAAAALTQVDALLQSAIDATAEFGSKQKRVQKEMTSDKAVIENLKLWKILFLDLVNPDNKLPLDVKKSLIELSDFTQSHSRKVLLGEATHDVLIDINNSIIAGLRRAVLS